MSQRIKFLSFTALANPLGGSTLNITAPLSTQKTLAPPGHYMLFIINSNGAPSVAKIVQLLSVGAMSNSWRVRAVPRAKVGSRMKVEAFLRVAVLCSTLLAPGASTSALAHEVGGYRPRDRVRG